MFFQNFNKRFVLCGLLTISTAIAPLVLFFYADNIVWAQEDASLVTQRRTELERELAELEKEIDAQRVILDNKQRERVSLERDLAILDAKIQKARLSIKARELVISKLRADIKGKEGVIVGLEGQISNQKQTLAALIRKTNEYDYYSFSELVLSSRELSDFFADVNTYAVLKDAVRESFKRLESNKLATQVQKESLESKVSEEIDLKKIQELEKRRIEEQEAEKKRIVKLSKGQEAEYQKTISAKEKNATAIRTELFSLRGSAAIPFDRAYTLAKKAGAKTGVRPAVILGIIAEESNLGENVGTGNWKVDMKNSRDTVPFLDIVSRLGLNPDEMPVSKKPWYGYGGAMGPAQFIPSTWILYEDRIAKETGHNPPNPWDPEDAFMAAAILLMDNGADAKTRSSERLAALRYFAGWKNASNKSYAFYGDDVMDLTDKYQKLIDILESS